MEVFPEGSTKIPEASFFLFKVSQSLCADNYKHANKSNSLMLRRKYHSKYKELKGDATE